MDQITDSMHAGLCKELLARQIQFLEDMVAHRRMKTFEDVLSKVRGRRARDGAMVDQWVFIDYKDAGEDWRDAGRLHCECGRKLRYQYTLENKQTGLRKSFGLNHLTEHTGIPPELAREIVKQLNRLQSEKDEMIKKWKAGWTLESEGITCLPPDLHLPESILRHLHCSMPLLQCQVTQLKKIILQYERTKEEKKLQAIVAQEKKQLKQLEHLP